MLDIAELVTTVLDATGPGEHDGAAHVRADLVELERQDQWPTVVGEGAQGGSALDDFGGIRPGGQEVTGAGGRVERHDGEPRAR